MKETTNNWTVTTIGEVYNFVGGGTPSKANPAFWNGDIPWASIKDISQIESLEKTQDYITKEGVEKSAANIADVDEVILGTRMLPGKAVITKIRTAINQDLKIVRPTIQIPSKFTKYQFDYLKEEFISRSSGTTVQGITIEKIKTIPFILPPPAEQERIVAKLDKLFAHLDQLKARLEKIPDLLKQFRQAVLTQAVTGKLTEEWRGLNQDVLDAKKLLESLAKSRLNNKERKVAAIENHNDVVLPATWQWCQLDQVSVLITDGKHGDCNNEPDSGYFFLSAKDISGGVLRYEGAREIVYEEFLETHRRTNLEAGDICVVNTGATVGKSAIVQQNEFTSRTTFQKSVAVIKLFKEAVNPKFINYIIQLETPRILKRSGGSAINNWLLSEMRAFWCQLPPTREQDEIVRRVESLFAVADRIEAGYKTLKEKIDQLPQAILSKAFKGELVKEDVRRTINEYSQELENINIAAEP